MQKNLGLSIVIAASLLAAAVLVGTWKISRSVDDAAEHVAAFTTAVDDLQDSLKQAAPAAAPRPSGPDPNRRYTINLDGAPTRGNEKAKVTVVELSDFQCPFCAKVVPTLEQLEQEYGDRVRFAYKHLPLSMHPKAPAAHAAAEAANRQGHFWDMHKMIFEHQAEMSPEKYKEWAGEIGLDVKRFEKDVASNDVKQRIDRDAQEANGMGVTGTPSFFVNGRFLQGARPIEAFRQLIDEELQRAGG